MRILGIRPTFPRTVTIRISLQSEYLFDYNLNIKILNRKKDDPFSYAQGSTSPYGSHFT